MNRGRQLVQRAQATHTQAPAPVPVPVPAPHPVLPGGQLVLQLFANQIPQQNRTIDEEYLLCSQEEMTRHLELKRVFDTNTVFRPLFYVHLRTTDISFDLSAFGMHAAPVITTEVRLYDAYGRWHLMCPGNEQRLLRQALVALMRITGRKRFAKQVVLSQLLVGAFHRRVGAASPLHRHFEKGALAERHVLSKITEFLY